MEHQQADTGGEDDEAHEGRLGTFLDLATHIGGEVCALAGHLYTFPNAERGVLLPRE